MKKALKIIFLFCFLLLAFHSLPALTLDETLDTLSAISDNKAQFRWDPLLRDGVFNMGDHYGVFSTTAKEGETGFLVFDNRELFNVPMPYNDNGKLIFPENFVVTLKNAFSKSLENDSSRFRITTIVIDPGHGGRDSGAARNMVLNGKTVQVVEKDIVLKAGLILRDMLNRTYPDKRIMMTRDSDVFPSLEQRADMANAVSVKDNEAVIFISIHANASVNSNARGYEVWHINSGYRRTLLDKSKHNYSADITAILNAMLEEEYTTESILLADSILLGLGQEFGKSVPSRGRKANDWFVVRNSRMPAVLVELGFVSNPQDAVLMTSDEGLQRLIDSLYNGITNFIGIFER
ncbi:MAG: N-acetylmuramoyl-L-alanine amidase [Treponema sp.]|jgi:N-acetylmuramoyl-L-alanine amidase|nr:N-acetylmuramoyl-L-alanine amidase [Treponema sp.]